MIGLKQPIIPVFTAAGQMVTPTDKPFDKHAELAALFRAGVAGDTVRYNQFLQKTSLILRRMMAKRLPSSDLEDVVQDILISVHKARHTYDGQRPLLPWLFAIARFRINDYLRRHYNQSRREVDIERVAEPLADDVTKSHDESESIDELLKGVPEKHKRILTLMYVEGFTAKEAGQQMDMKESAVKVAAHRAIKKIRERLGT